MDSREQKEMAKAFAKRWAGRGRERSESQSFWLSLLGEVYGIAKPDEYIRFEEPVQLSHKSFIDGFIDSTHVMIEQKSIDKDLTEPIKQSDGTFLTPYQQAKRYAAELPYSKRPRWIIACNFAEFHIYDMENPQAKPEVILLENLPTDFYRLNFLIDKTSDNIKRELELSIKAGEIVGKLYDALHKQYINPNSEESLKSLNKLCVRLVFCLYAESAGIFNRRNMFREYLQSFREKNIRRALIDLFEVLNTPVENRDPYMEDDLKIFPYVNGGLFDKDNIEIPKLTNEIIDLIIHQASEEFDWSGISPTIFGAVFESTLNPATRRTGGMHYTSIENIHKVIDNLFLNDLHAEFAKIKSATRNRKKLLLDFQLKLSQLKFFDPACGSGNFLTESYLSLRRLENEILRKLLGDKILLGELNNPIKVSISQFYGIEINDFACAVAQSALWIAESQMMAETAEIVHKDLDFLPLKTYTNIEEGNSLQIDWHAVAPNVNFIFGNPPFVGFTFQTDEQKKDLQNIFPKVKNLDYVCCWFKKAADFIQDTKIECAFVSTNSITQGETVSQLWKFLDTTINFAYRSFVWDSESNSKAHVHCVIIGFANFHRDKKIIFDGDKKILAENINAYLLDAPDTLIQSRNKPLCDVPKMVYGNKPADGGFLILSELDKNLLIEKYPQAEKFIRPLLGAEEFLHNKKRYCLWLVNASPSAIKKIPPIYERVQLCKEKRLQSIAAGIRKFAETPTLFAQITQPEGKNFIIVPRVSSERREYIPMDFLSAEIKVTDAVQIIPDAELYHFGVLQSSVHMAWTRAVCGRLESRYRYSKDIVYNNFVWCKPTENQRKKIELTAQNILTVRKTYLSDAQICPTTLADLYDPLLMPKDLKNAHKANDAAVMAAYGIEKNFSESEIVAELMKLYQSLNFSR